MAAKNIQQLARVNGRGEHVVLVTRKVHPNPDGTMAVEAQINLDAAAVPERRYSADCVDVTFDEETTSILLGQRALGGKLRSLIIVKLSAEATRRVLSTCEKFTPLLQGLLQRNGIKKPPLHPVQTEPAQVVVLTANLVAVGYTQREAVVDFYHYSAMALRRLNDSSELEIDPVVRVDLTTSLLATMLDGLDVVREVLPREIT